MTTTTETTIDAPAMIADGAIDLLAFCDPDRVILEQPFKLPDADDGSETDGRIYASDGIIMIRVVDGGEWKDADRHPNGSKFGAQIRKMWTNAVRSGMVPWDQAGPLPGGWEGTETTCTHCAGTGTQISVNCAKCEGSGMKTCPTCEHENDCAECEGIGSSVRPPTDADDKHGAHAIDCCECDARGSIFNDGPKIEVMFGHNLFNAKYLSRIAGLPKLSIATEATSTVDGNYRGIWFTFDGGDGLIMPMWTGRSDKVAPQLIAGWPDQATLVLA